MLLGAVHPLPQEQCQEPCVGSESPFQIYFSGPQEHLFPQKIFILKVGVCLFFPLA